MYCSIIGDTSTSSEVSVSSEIMDSAVLVLLKYDSFNVATFCAKDFSLSKLTDSASDVSFSTCVYAKSFDASRITAARFKDTSSSLIAIAFVVASLT